MNESVFTINGFIITRGALFAAAAALVLAVILFGLGAARRRLARRRAAEQAAARVADLVRAQNESAARDQLHRNADQLAKVALPMATEPAFQFKA